MARYLLACAGLAVTGCAMMPPNSFLDPTQVGTFPAEYREGGVLRVLTPREGPEGLANATEPTAEDLVALNEEYRAGPNDGIGILIDEFLSPGFPFQATLEVNPNGFIRLPQLGFVKVLGLTEAEIEQELRTQVEKAGILNRPIVQVVISTRRQQTFQIVGSVRAPGTYPIVYNDMSLLDAISLAGDIGAGVRKLYVIRRAPRNYRGSSPTAPQRSEPAGEQPQQPPAERMIIPPPDLEPLGSPEGTLFARLGPSAEMNQDSAPAPQELDELIAPRPASQPRGDGRPQSVPGEARPFPPLIFDPQTGAMREAPAETRPDRTLPTTPTPAPFEAPPAAQRSEFDWDDVRDAEPSQRVIEIDVPGLKGGDPRMNIVLRNRDSIIVPVDVGLFYVMGQVNRPGPYAFNEREITLKQAIATVGGFAPLAWPQRCEIIRKEKGTDKQLTIPVDLDAIFAGLAPDIVLKDDDIVNVGTHLVAPFLFVIRNSFRFTYGFGFVYDRNFADQDSYGSKENPQSRADRLRATRGLPF